MFVVVTEGQLLVLISQKLRKGTAETPQKGANIMSAGVTCKPIEVLLVEDNPGDVVLTVEAFQGGKMTNHLSIVEDGEEAMAYLRQEGRYADAAAPDLILLDLNLPKMDGREVLQEIKKDEHLRRIPVVILTTSTAEQDILKTYDLHANCYINKPVNFDEFLTVVRAIENFWLTIVKLPQNGEPYVGRKC